MFHFERLITIGLVVFTIACTQQQNFKKNEAKNNPSQLTAMGGVDPLCQLNGTSPFWIDQGTTTVDCPNLCPDGSHQQCLAFLQKEVQCVDGTVTFLGPTQPGELISVIGECPIAPQNCGDKQNGAQWWQDTGTTTNITCELCPDGSPHLCNVNVQAQYQCQNGVTSTTGAVQNGSVVNYTNECLPVPPPPVACGNQPGGSQWWQITGQQTSVCQTCWDGTQITCTYNTETQETCSNGNVTPTGQTQQGTLISKNGECLEQPTNCGNVGNNQTTWQSNGQTAPYQCDVCVDGTPHMCIAEIDQQLVCRSGTLFPTGQTKNGPVIGYVNTCPNVTPVSESYKVPTASPKADVLFVVDTTPVMFKVIESLSKKFANLTSSWGNVDWQIGIANADVTPSHVNFHISPGDLITLNVYPNDQVTTPLTVLNNNVKWADWIFRRNLSFNGLSWPGSEFCDQQPYCSLGPAEPLKEIIYAMDHKADASNKTFFRPGSTFVPVILSATDERGKGANVKGAILPADVVDHFTKTMPEMAGIHAYSFIIQPNDKACLDQFSSILKLGSGGVYGTYLDQFAAQTGGQSISLCQNDYSQSLSNLSQVIRQQVSSIQLQQEPYNNSLKITFAPAIPHIAWTVQGKQVVFNQPLPAGTVLSIQYLVLQP